MKKQYKYIEDWWCKRGAYQLVSGHYFRQLNTFNERRQNEGHKADGIRIRGRRSRALPSSWDDLHHSQMFGKDWKRFTKRKHQWRDKDG